MKIVKKKLSDLKRAQQNIRIHPEKQITEYIRSLNKNGQLKPLVIDENNIIWIGNGLFEAMSKRGDTEAFCLVKEGMTEADKKKMMMADNRIFDLGADDMIAFDAFVFELKDDLDIPGFDEDILKSFIRDAEKNDDFLLEYGLTSQDQINTSNNNKSINKDLINKEEYWPDNSPDDEESETTPVDQWDDACVIPDAPITIPGDIWYLGRHRLMCGDATVRSSMQQLMSEDRAHLVFTDPPYGVEYTGGFGKAWEMITNDDKKGDNLLLSLLIPAFKNLAEFALDEAAFYIWHASTTRRDFDDALIAAGLIERQYIIWVKNSFQLGHADYHWGHESCYYAHKAGQTVQFYGDRTQQTVWRAVLRSVSGLETTVKGGIVITDGAGGKIFISDKAPAGKKFRSIRCKEHDIIKLYSENKMTTAWAVSKETKLEHPTQKPVELAIRAIKNSSKVGDIVMDAFGGSGTTLIAAELTGRNARLMEIDPKYCDVIVGRYERITGRTDGYCIRDGKKMAYSTLCTNI